jgi:hypothetical protein
VFLLLGGCDGKPPPESPSDDPHVIPNEGNWDEDREFISPPNLGYPIYACSTNVTITDFLADAQLNVFINGSPAPNPSTTGIDPDLGVNFETGHTFVSGDTVFVTQSRDGATSSPSNEVTATDHSEDYPDGLPQPRLWKDPLHQCGKAILVEGVVPGSMVTVSAEDPAGAGTFDPPHDVGSFNASTKWGHNWTGVNPNFELGARVTAKAKLCADAGWCGPYGLDSAGDYGPEFRGDAGVVQRGKPGGYDHRFALRGSAPTDHRAAAARSHTDPRHRPRSRRRYHRLPR